MHTVLLGLGSNIEPEFHLSQAAVALRALLPEVQFSSVYRSKAVGMDGDDFLNACALLKGVNDVEVLQVWLKALEDQHGRDRSEGSWKPRTLDLDILMVDEALLEEDVYQYAHVLVPASELIPCKAIAGKAYALVKKVELEL